MLPGTNMERLPGMIPVGASKRLLAGLGFDQQQATFESQQAKEERSQQLLMQQLTWARDDYKDARQDARDSADSARRQQSDQLASQRFSEAQQAAIEAAKQAANQSASVTKGILSTGRSSLKTLLLATGGVLLASYVLFAKKVGGKKAKAAS